MNLKILEPFRVYAEKANVRRIVAEGCEGSFGLLPHRRDCVVALVPGILVYQADGEGETFIATDEGILVKTAGEVRVSVRRAIGGADLNELRASVEKEFRDLDADDRSARDATTKLEAGFLRRFASFRHE